MDEAERGRLGPFLREGLTLALPNESALRANLAVSLTRPSPTASSHRVNAHQGLAFAFESSFQTKGVIPWRRYSARTVLAARWKARSARRTKAGVFGPDFFTIVLMG